MMRTMRSNIVSKVRRVSTYTEGNITDANNANPIHAQAIGLILYMYKRTLRTRGRVRKPKPCTTVKVYPGTCQ